MKIRLGIMLWILSWIPYGLIFGLSGAALTIAWTVEILLGITGLAIAGTEFAQAVKDKGWKGAPAVAWRSLVHRQGHRSQRVVSPNAAISGPVLGIPDRRICIARKSARAKALPYPRQVDTRRIRGGRGP